MTTTEKVDDSSEKKDFRSFVTEDIKPEYHRPDKKKNAGDKSTRPLSRSKKIPGSSENYRALKLKQRDGTYKTVYLK